MPMSSSNEIQSYKPFLHTVFPVGYDDNKDHVVLNSWGSSFSKNGCFYMPYKYILILHDAVTFERSREFGRKDHSQHVITHSVSRNFMTFKIEQVLFHYFCGRNITDYNFL